MSVKKRVRVCGVGFQCVGVATENYGCCTAKHGTTHNFDIPDGGQFHVTCQGGCFHIEKVMHFK